MRNSKVLKSHNSLPLYSFKRLEPIFSVCLISILNLTVFVVYNYLMPWLFFYCKIREGPKHQQKGTLQSIPLRFTSKVCGFLFSSERCSPPPTLNKLVSPLPRILATSSNQLPVVSIGNRQVGEALVDKLTQVQGSGPHRNDTWPSECDMINTSLLCFHGDLSKRCYFNSNSLQVPGKTSSPAFFVSIVTSVNTSMATFENCFG